VRVEEALSDAAASNLSGVWHGQYTYDEPGREAVGFIAELSDAAGVLAGWTEETVEVAGAPATLRAALQGKRSGGFVTLVKLYERVQSSAPGRVYDYVHYEGDVTPDGCEIEGRWNVRTSSGRFLMLREGGEGAKVASRATERA